MKKYFILLAMLLITLPCYSAIKVSPTIIELDANKARGNYLTTSFDIQGGENETIRFKIYPEFFEISEEGRMKVIENSDSLNSLVNNIRFVPSEFTLTNGQKQKIRVTFNDISKLPDGESRVVLFMEDVVAKEVVLPAGGNISSKLLVKSRLGVPIYIDKGKYTKIGQFDDLSVKNQYDELIYSIKLSSIGNSKIRYTGTGQIIKDKELIREFDIPSNAVSAKGMFNCSFKIPAEDIKENGDYTLRLILEYKNEKNETKKLVKETQFKSENTTASQ